MPQDEACSQRIGNAPGGALLDQFVLTRPASVSWNWTVPLPTGALSGPSVVQRSENASPLGLPTLTFSFVGVGLYALSRHE